MDLSDLRLFKAVVDEGGVTRAASKVHRVQSNLSSRIRALDAVPFTSRLVFDMEASPGVDQRKTTDFLGYSSVVFYYARPGSLCSLAPAPDAARKPIMSLDDIEKAANDSKQK